MGMRGVSCLLAAGLASACCAEVVYSNDFATRTSTTPVPRTDLFAKACAYPAPLFYSYDAPADPADFATTLPYANADRVQDGWTKIQGNNPETQRVNFWARVDQDPSNPFAAFSNQTGLYGEQHEAMAIQTLHNAFDTGVLRFSVDLRAPFARKSATEYGYFRFKPLFSSRTTPSGTSYAPYALAFGASDGGNVLNVVYSDGKWDNPSTIGNNLVANPDRSHWFRYVADLDLDTDTFTCSVYDLGAEQPTLDTPTPATAAGTLAGKKLYRPVSVHGPVCGFGLHAKDITAYSALSASDSTLVYTNAPCADNIRAWWKPAGRAGDFTADDLVYENDFRTRRFRHVQGTTSSSDYATALSVPASDAYSFWNVADRADVTNSANLVNSLTAPGRDDWRLTDVNKSGFGVVRATTAGNNALAFALNGGYAKVAHAIGRPITSGKVLLEADLRLPDKWYTSSSRTFSVCLGTDELAREKNSGYAVRVGVAGVNDDKTNAFHPYAYADTATGGSRTDTGVQLEAGTWYRVRVVADLASRTYDFALYALGSKSGGFDREVPSEPVHRRTGVGFFPATAPSEITTVAVYSYASGATWEGAELADNLRVATGTDGTTWTTVYQNDFTTRTRWDARTAPEAKLLDADFNRAGLDNWMRRGGLSYDADWVVRDIDGNPCLASEREDAIAFATQALGKPLARGKAKVRVDMRPPLRCTMNSSQVGRVWIGGDEFAQGEIGTYDGRLRSFMNAALAHFGLAQSGSATTMGYYTKFAPYAYDASGTKTADLEISGNARNNWYRFVASFDMDKGKWSLDVFDQGAAHPALDAANGTRVATIADLVLRNEDPTGFSSIGISAGASAAYAPLEADTKCVLLDNLVVEKVPSGLMLVVR